MRLKAGKVGLEEWVLEEVEQDIFIRALALALIRRRCSPVIALTKLQFPHLEVIVLSELPDDVTGKKKMKREPEIRG